MKRFYKSATIGEGPEGFQALLDGKPVKTPKRRSLTLPGQALARAVVAEWNAAGEQIRADDMPVTKLANSVIDLMPDRRDVAVAEAAGFAETDLLCYRAAEPAGLVERQTMIWQPWLDWFEQTHSIALGTTAGMTPVAQSPEALARSRALVDSLDDWRLVALHSATQITGSLVLGLALLEHRLAAPEALAAALLDEHYAIEQWGEEQEQLKRHRHLARDLQGVAVFLEALRQED